ncbi:MAG: phenylacetate--CoA ligase family protein [Burkholderiales bacterium]|nr:phenylacetate--CoA ligase family protein [Burkholderiales bacterium]
MHPYTSLISSAVFPLHERFKGHRSTSLRRQLEKTQWLNSEQIDAAIRLPKLRAFLDRIATTVPYYQEIFASTGFSPTTIHSLGDLARVPLLTKADIRSRQDSFRSRNAISLRRLNTGGSSGEPLIFFVGSERVSHDVAAKWRATRWWGVDIGDPEMVVWGSPIELGTQDRVRLIRDKLLRSELLPAFDLSRDALRDAVTRIRKRRPRMLFGYPSALSMIAKYAESEGIRLNNVGIKVVFVTSEMLYPDQRSAMQRVYGCSVANGYGGRDSGFIAHECPSGRMHISAEDIIVEIVDAAGNVLPSGQCGEIVVTHLATADFPFVRYRTGDMGALSDEQCPCGRGLPVLAEVQGRSTDFVVARDGTVMHGLALIYVVRDLPGVGKFKIVQESIDSIRVMVVKEQGFAEDTRARIVQGISARLGSNVNVIVDVVNDIRPGKSGKYRYVESHVHQPGLELEA